MQIDDTGYRIQSSMKGATFLHQHDFEIEHLLKAEDTW